MDVRTSPADGSLLFTTDRDDFMRDEVGHNAGGLYRIIYNSSSSSAEATSGTGEPATPVPREGWPSNGIIGNDSNFDIERLAVLPCARQMTQSVTHPLIIYVSTLKEFCQHTNADDPDLDKGAIWAVKLDASVSRKAIIVEQLLDPQGIDWANGAPYIATSDRGSRGTRKLCAEDPRTRFDRAVGMYFDQNGNLMFIDNGR